jgi:hypothetical protein
MANQPTALDTGATTLMARESYLSTVTSRRSGTVDSTGPASLSE